MMRGPRMSRSLVSTESLDVLASAITAFFAAQNVKIVWAVHATPYVPSSS